MFVYIHIPFCENKCKYCRFASFSGVQDFKIEKYLKFLQDEINFKLDKLDNIETIYFGGGTPSILNINQLEQIINLINSRKKDKNLEITIETTPNNLTKNNIIGWKKLGINRISIGVQTLNNKTLKEIGRASKGDILKSLDLVKDILFENISLDFIIGLPYVKSSEIKENIAFLIKKYDFIKHISVYMLEDYYDIKTEKDSSFENIIYPKNWLQLGIKEEQFLQEYEDITYFLEENNFKRYEISNFAKPGYECKHNKSYWSHQNYIGFGLGASSYLDKKRLTNADNFKDYYEKKNIFIENLTKYELDFEKLMFQLRTSGINILDFPFLNKEKIDYFINSGLLFYENSLLKLTNKGILLLDYILKEI